MITIPKIRPLYAWCAGGGCALAALLTGAYLVPSTHPYIESGWHWSLVQLGLAVPYTEPAQQSVQTAKQPTEEEKLKERVATLEEEVGKQKQDIATLQAQSLSVSQELKAAETELGTATDYLQRREAEWTAALRRVGVVSPAVSPLPSLDFASSGGSAGNSAVAQADGKINLNTATAAELDSLPGIGPTYAQRIVDYREQKGSFKKVDDVQEVEGIGASTFDKIKDKITV